MSNTYQQYFAFELDDFQKQAIEALKADQNVVVCAPTGSGKTVIAEYAAILAMESGKSLFYTTPLKALSNQKYHDLKQCYGEDNVGLLTGDLSINRDARLVVMTTEIFRNMLYGTRSESALLNRLGYVVLDECHFMNDADRGTVWEESIIYCPSHVRLLALSATVSNAQELTGWMNAIHPTTTLIESDFRPVPLRFFYYKAEENELLPLFDGPNKKGVVNRKLKNDLADKRLGHKAKAFKPHELIVELHHGLNDSGSMLPAIFFTFSRKGCDQGMKEAAKMLSRPGQPALTTPEERTRIQASIDDMLQQSPYLANEALLKCLPLGLACHHAGLLPALKVLVEHLFQSGLIKAVFATETLAAGINMPARTTVITSITKRSDEGHRTLNPSEFLQMSGRAGRRGLDTQGYVVVVSSHFHSAQTVATLASADADPLNSRFTPTYGMVMNVLQQHSLDEAAFLIEKSFSQYTSKRRLAPLKATLDEKQAQLDNALSFNCHAGWTHDQFEDYLSAQTHAKALMKQLKTMQKQLKLHGDNPDIAAECSRLKQQWQAKQTALKADPCYDCKKFMLHRRTLDKLERYQHQVTLLAKDYDAQQHAQWNSFLNLKSLLAEVGYLTPKVPDPAYENMHTWQVNTAGAICSQVRTENELYLAQLITSGILDALTPPQLAGLLSCITMDSVRENAMSFIKASPDTWNAVRQLYNIQKQVLRLQEAHGIETPVIVQPIPAGLCEAWTMGLPWNKLVENTSLDAGDLVRMLRRTADLLRQISRIAEVPDAVSQTARKALRALYRDPIREAEILQSSDEATDQAELSTATTEAAN